MTAADSNAQMSHDDGLKNSFTLCSVVAKIATVLVHRQVRKVQGRRFRIRQRARPPRTRHFRVRTRRSVEDIYNELGPMYFRRAYRMKYSTFKKLADELRPNIILACGQKGSHKRFVPNGLISPDVRLACAIRWFAGGSAYDLMTSYGIGHSDTMRSYWYVVDAINSHPNFKIEYPKDHEDQRQIARGFQKVSRAGFKCCAGAIDGILIWIHKPSKKDCMDVGCNDGKFMCSRKSKFGLNCQAVCDVRGRILDISIMYPGSTSDCLAFEGMSLFHQLENGLLAPGLCIFGDNAYLYGNSIPGGVWWDKGCLQLLSFAAANTHRMHLWDVDTPLGNTAERDTSEYQN
jgi:DDE superfamily endonuclease